MFIKKMYGLLATDTDRSFVWATLNKNGYSKDENDLVRAIDDSKSKKIVHFAVIGLMEVGTKKSISVLKKLSTYPNQDVRVSSIVCIAKITRENETLYYSELLFKMRNAEKMFPLTLLWEAGDDKAVPEVRKFAEMYLINKNLRDYIDPRYILEYLKRCDRDFKQYGLVEQGLAKYVKDLKYAY